MDYCVVLLATEKAVKDDIAASCLAYIRHEASP
jgi:hypothetical protein